MAIDGTEMSADASINANRNFGQVAPRDPIVRPEDQLYGQDRGDVFPQRSAIIVPS